MLPFRNRGYYQPSSHTTSQDPGDRFMKSHFFLIRPPPLRPPSLRWGLLLLLAYLQRSPLELAGLRA
jgi:hypothetical protein